MHSNKLVDDAKKNKLCWILQPSNSYLSNTLTPLQMLTSFVGQALTIRRLFGVASSLIDTRTEVQTLGW